MTDELPGVAMVLAMVVGLIGTALVVSLGVIGLIRLWVGCAG